LMVLANAALLARDVVVGLLKVGGRSRVGPAQGLDEDD
jgi:hypothetical protein